MSAAPDTTALHVDVGGAVEFLQVITPAGVFGNVTAIDPNIANTCTGIGFDSSSLSRAREFIERHADQNLYWTVNTLADRVDKKPAKTDIGAMRYAHLDLDEPTEEALQRIRTATPPPSLIIFSGGGYGAFWQLDKPVHINRDVTALERINQHLIEIFAAGKGTWNLDRLMRLPCTVNWLSEAKRKRGRKAAATYIVEHHPERTYTIEQLVTITCDEPKARGTSEPTQLFSGSIKGNGKAASKSRSEDLLARVGAAVRDGETDETIHSQFGAHPHAADQANPVRAVDRAIHRARTDWALDQSSRADQRVGDPTLSPADADKTIPDPITIELRAGRLPHALKQVRRVLADHAEDLSLMVFGRSLVRPFIVNQRGFRGEAVEALELSCVSVRALAAYMDSVAQFGRWRSRARKAIRRNSLCATAQRRLLSYSLKPQKAGVACRASIGSAKHRCSETGNLSPSAVTTPMLLCGYTRHRIFSCARR